VMLKSGSAWNRTPPPMADSTVGWRFTNPKMNKEWTISLGETAEKVAAQYGVSRAEQDAFAVESQARAQKALASGVFADELVPVPLPGKENAGKSFTTDEHPRAGVTLDSLAKMKPAFVTDGTVTAASSSGINDGSAAMTVVSGDAMRELGLKPMARIISSAVAGVDPSIMGIGPVPAVRKALARAGIKAADLDLVELNEAFAAQAIPCIRELGLDPAKVNIYGGAIALGHPLGASGAKILTTLVHALRRTGGRYGVASMCIGVGQGIALVVESVKD
jgi:acetyl-CoA acetyltransferase family protein